MGQFGRYSSSNYLKDAPATILGAMRINEARKSREQAGEIAEGKLGIEKRKTAVLESQEERVQTAVPVAERPITEEQGKGIAGMFPGVSEEGQGLSTPNISKPIDYSEFTIMEAQIKSFGKKMGVPNLSKSLESYTNFTKGLTKQGYNRYEVFRTSTEQWDRYKQEPMDEIQKGIDTAMERGHMAKVEELSKLKASYENGDVLKTVFSASNRYHEAALAAQIEKDKPPSRLEQSLATQHVGDPVKTENLWREMIGKSKSSKTTQPRSIKTWQTPEGKKMNLPNNVMPPKGSVPYKDDRLTEKDAAKAEEIIRTNPSNEAVKGQIGIHNRYSKQPYALIWHKGKKQPWYKPWAETDNVKQVDLPIMDGKQVTSNEVWATAQKHNISFHEVLKKIGALK